ncbi:glycoside hydrolase family 88 protein [Parabacteroides faecis]|uniref:glycoside hydrolase family 88 protein n=1 Tax=Parabacteroides faecis TaxID=1217282 RepID=UPI00352100BA
MYKLYSLLLLFILSGVSCSGDKATLDTDASLKYCEQQVNRSLPLLKESFKIPRNILSDESSGNWNCTSIYDWTSGFWPGILWYLYEYDHDENIKKAAERFTAALYPVVDRKADNHDLGFMMYCSLGNGYRLTGNEEYKKVLLRAADSLATLYDLRVGTIHSWPGMREKMGWPHNTIIDNMLNLELLFWAAKNGGGEQLYKIANRHAEVTMENQFRNDFSTCHVVVYDTITGNRIKQVTHQGYADSSMWARGQGWAIYGFTMCYRETRNPAFLETARKAADLYLSRLPEDMIPYWDFDAPGLPEEPRDASAAAVVASGLLEMSLYMQDEVDAEKYKSAAVKILASLSSPAYQSREHNQAFLLHSTGHKPNNSEIDASIIYADYYYIEALIRLDKINKTGAI